MLFYFIVGCAILALRIAHRLRLDSARREAAQAIQTEAANETASPMTQFTILTTSTPRRLEALPDSHRTGFAFYNVLVDEDFPRGHTLVKACDEGNWQTIRDTLAELRLSMNSEFAKTDSCPKTISSFNTERALCCDILTGQISRTWSSSVEDDVVFCPWLDEWCRAEPDNPDARWLRCDAKISWAWHARTGAIARQVSVDRVRLFRERLSEANDDMEVTFRLFPPHDPVIFSSAITLAMALQKIDEETLEDYLQRLSCTADPYHIPPHLSAFQAECSKWGGSHERMYAYVRRVTKEIPSGHPLWMLIPMALEELTLFFDNQQRMNLVRQHPKVVDELVLAYHRALGATDFEHKMDPSLSVAERSLNRQMRGNFIETLYTYTNRDDLVRSQVRVIGKRPSRCGWNGIASYQRVILQLGFSIEETVPIAVATIV